MTSAPFGTDTQAQFDTKVIGGKVVHVPISSRDTTRFQRHHDGFSEQLLSSLQAQRGKLAQFMLFLEHAERDAGGSIKHSTVLKHLKRARLPVPVSDFCSLLSSLSDPHGSDKLPLKVLLEQLKAASNGTASATVWRSTPAADPATTREPSRTSSANSIARYAVVPAIGSALLHQLSATPTLASQSEASPTAKLEHSRPPAQPIHRQATLQPLPWMERFLHLQRALISSANQFGGMDSEMLARMVQNYNTVYALDIPMVLVADLIAGLEEANRTCSVADFVQDLTDGLTMLNRL
eukprot:TRINITY_DN5732_c0_g1_i1.p1 TRINITY_DN5732_c0_g1~~TRINITY_DN5732_c0_g1_i1.p1  ORF type:complete len:294 (+),score=35.03 TRINITY_DN5732_c0_g1_i1:67-948(+)